MRSMRRCCLCHSYDRVTAPTSFCPRAGYRVRFLHPGKPYSPPGISAIFDSVGPASGYNYKLGYAFVVSPLYGDTIRLRMGAYERTNQQDIYLVASTGNATKKMFSLTNAVILICCTNDGGLGLKAIRTAGACRPCLPSTISQQYILPVERQAESSCPSLCRDCCKFRKLLSEIRHSASIPAYSKYYIRS
ncbi:hypothetical protein ABW21_db0200497 [Orbilia brochopaga]|nr:hypothetical protein ABW21_db0200497 [Drechslerella brochopaga]